MSYETIIFEREAGDRIGAQEAYQIGLVNKVLPPEGSMFEAKRWAAELAERPPLSLKMLKYCVNLGMQMDLLGGLDYEAKCAALLTNTEDRAEGMRAFVRSENRCSRGDSQNVQYQANKEVSWQRVKQRKGCP